MPLTEMRAALTATPATALMHGPVKTAYERWPLARLVEFFIENGITGAPVLALDGTLVGVVSVSDVLRAGSAATADACRLPPSGYLKNAGLGYELGRRELAQLLRNTAPPGLTVGEVMTRNVIQVEAGSSALSALQLMHARGIHRVFVTKSGRVVGVISQGSLLAGLAAVPEGTGERKATAAA